VSLNSATSFFTTVLFFLSNKIQIPCVYSSEF